MRLSDLAKSKSHKAILQTEFDFAKSDKLLSHFSFRLKYKKNAS